MAQQIARIFKRASRGEIGAELHVDSKSGASDTPLTARLPQRFVQRRSADQTPFWGTDSSISILTVVVSLLDDVVIAIVADDVIAVAAGGLVGSGFAVDAVFATAALNIVVAVAAHSNPATPVPCARKPRMRIRRLSRATIFSG